MPSWRNSAVWRGERSVLATRKRGDSGSHAQSTGNIASGTMPPKTNTPGQPNLGSNRPAACPHKKPPNGAPVKETMIIVARRRCGA
jgi:hypothetical protein